MMIPISDFRTFTCWVTQKVSIMSVRPHDFLFHQVMRLEAKRESQICAMVLETPSATIKCALQCSALAGLSAS